MNRQTTTESYQAPLTEGDVSEYLRAHPDFFVRHLALLEIMRLPHPSQGAVSLVERQMSVLRERNRQLDRKLNELIQLARENEQLSANLHRLGLGLIQADSLDSVLATTREQLCEEFKADEVVVRLMGITLSDRFHHQGMSDTDCMFACFNELFERRRPLCGHARREQLDCLFGDEVAESLGSAVLIPLCDTEPLGVLALGSRDASRFHPSMGTLFLGYLGELVGAAVSKCLGRT